MYALAVLAPMGVAFAQSSPESGVIPSALTQNSMDTSGVYTYLTVQATASAQGAVVVLNTATNTPEILTTFTMPCVQPNGILISGSYAYVTCYDSGELYVLTINNSNPTVPVLAILGIVGGLQGPFPGISLAGTHVYIPSHAPGNQGAIYRVDVSNPAAPAIDGSIATTPSISPNAVFVTGGYMYCACASEPDTSYVEVFTADGTITSLGRVALAHSPQRLVVRGNYAYVTNFDAEQLDVIDISTPASPSVAATVPLACYGLPIALSGSYAYVGCYAADGVAKIDISVPSAPVLVSKTATSASPVQALGMNGPRLLAAAGVAGGSFTERNLGGDALSVWVANGGSVAALNIDGSVYQPASSNGGVGVAIDAAGNVWSANASSVTEFSSAGSVLSGGYSIGAGNTPAALAVDGLGAGVDSKQQWQRLAAQ
jgi:hypothetical protein